MSAHFDAMRRATTLVVVAASACIAVTVLYTVKQRKGCRKGSLELPHDKPQSRFKKVLADNSPASFVHLLNPEGAHPYSGEICALLNSPPRKLVHHEFQKRPPNLEGPFEWIDSRAQLEKLASVLSHEAEFAVDTEQHSVHSFLGFTALMQISTFSNDYLVDTIALHDDMELLRPAFANPQICKVFHGADSDNMWLQRDFHLYIVNLFDTARACDVLGKPQRSLAYLLHEYCGVTTNKLFQRADWRQRPLPSEMLLYARMDSHYLSYIARCLEDELHSKGEVHEAAQDNGEESPFVQVVLRSNQLCLQLYDKDGASASPQSAARSLISRYGNSRVSCQPDSLKDNDIVHKVIKSLCEWRDQVARSEDESVQAVLSNSAVLSLAAYRPTSSEGILHALSAADPDSKSLATPGMRSHVRSLLDLMNQIAGEAGSQRQSIFWKKQQQRMSSFCDLISFLSNMLSTVFTHHGDDDGEAQVIQGSGSTTLEAGGLQLNGMTATVRNIEKRRNRGNWLKSRAQFVKKFSRKTPVYHNCRIYAGDGRLLCYCDRKKLEWYVNKGLAEYIDEDPPGVKLLFEPKGRPEDENNEFYILSKTNRCVGCGEKSHYLRYRVIPSCYRQHFPEYLKSHRSHDIVLLCVDCHEIAHRAAERHKHEVAEEFGVPLFLGKVGGTTREGKSEVKGSDDANGFEKISPLALRNAATALLRHGETLPSGRRVELESVVKTYYGGRNFSPEEFHAALLSCAGPRKQRRVLRRNGSQVVIPHGEVTESVTAKAESSYPLVGVPGADGKDLPATDCNQASNTSLLKAQREPVLGHGPHGKKVVEMLLEQGGDDAIRAFLRSWRKVFVHALQPAFLPPGWDIHHSGHREFGDHSVYNVKGTRRN